MTATSGTTSVWHASASLPHCPPLSGDDFADVCVIGAGIAGLSSAYLLLREGKSVVVIDAAGIGAGETGRTTAHFAPPDERYADIERRFGLEAAALVADSYREATDSVEAIIGREQIDCDFERLDGYLFSPDGTWSEILESELATSARLGLDVRRVERVPGQVFDSGPCLRFGNLAQFHPLKYLDGLARAIRRMGGRIYGSSRALDVHGDTQLRVVETAMGIIQAESVVVATNTPFTNRLIMHTKQAGYRSYVIALQVPAGALPHQLMWDTANPYYYARLTGAGADPGHELLVVGGQDHKVGQDRHPQHRYDEIETWVRQRFPMAGQVAFRWSGEVMEPADGLAFLGRNPLDLDNLYIITGDSGNGMTHCTAGALLITDLIMRRHNDWVALYSPERKAVHGVANFLGDQANTLAQYGDWLRGGDVDSVAEIAAGEGAVLRDGGRLLAVYRAEDGGLQAVSAACTHLGCSVHWNAGEKSWDCPCHGSRFSADGALLHGPAASPLAAASLGSASGTDVAPDGERPGQAGKSA